MRIRFVLLAIVLSCSSFCSIADQVVAFVDASDPKGPDLVKPYLAAATFRDQAYVYISAIVENPVGKPCVTPAANSFFADKKLDVTLTAQLFGFFGIDSTREVPLATYSWSSAEGAYCRSAWKAPVVLVPPSPMGVSRGISNPLTPADEPTIVVRLRTSSSDEEKISSYASSLLTIASGFATGGAATTVVGLTRLAGGPAAKFLSDQMNKLTQSQADQTTEVVISWNDLVSGMSTKKIQLMQSDLGWFNDPMDRAIEDLKGGRRQDAKPVLVVKFNFLVRRTVFVEDAKLLTTNYLPQDNVLIKPVAILNFPRNTGGIMEGFPTVFQTINSEAPSVFKKLSDKDVTACDPFLVAIRDLGFNEIDRAIVVGAVLDTSYPTWRSDSRFYQACLQSEPTITGRLKAIYDREGAPYFPVVVPPPILKQPELAENLPDKYWNSEIQEYMSNLRLALYSSGEARAASLKSLLETAPIVLDDTLATSSVSTDQRDRFIGASIKKIGCIFAFEGEKSKGFAAMVFTAQNNKNYSNTPYLLIADISIAPAMPTTLRQIWVYDLTKAPGADYKEAFGMAKFGTNSMCRSKDDNGTGRSVAAILKDIVN